MAFIRSLQGQHQNGREKLRIRGNVDRAVYADILKKEVIECDKVASRELVGNWLGNVSMKGELLHVEFTDLPAK